MNVHESLLITCMFAQILTDGDDSKAWLLSATKWAEVKVQSGSYRVMLSVRWKDKHRWRVKQMKGDKRD